MKYKKGLKIFSLFFILTGIFGFLMYSSQNQNGSGSIKASAGRISEAKVNGVLRPGDETNPNATPEYFTFNPNYKDKTWYNHYGSTKFYESMYLGQFYEYTFKGLESDVDLTKIDYSKLLENQLRKYRNGKYAVDKSYSWNLDYCSTPLNKQEPCTTPGHMTLPIGKYKGEQYEWRYIGYTYMGTVVENPYFPPDRLSSVWEQPWEYDKIITDFWEKGYHDASPFVPDDSNPNRTAQLKEFFGVLFEEYPGFVSKAKAERTDPYVYWSHRAMWETDPIKGAGEILIYHIANDGKTYYRTFTLESKPKPNLRITELKLTDKITNQVIGDVVVDPKDPLASPKYLINDGFVKNNKNYKVDVTVMNVPFDKPHDTVTNPTTIDARVAHDNNIWRFDAYDENFPDVAKSDNYPTSIPSGKTAHFTYDYKVDNSIVNEFEYTARIPSKYYTNGDNYNREDDKLSLHLMIEPEDISISEKIELLDHSGNEVAYPSPGQSYKLKFIVDKVYGETPLGEPDNPPNVTLDITRYDGKNTVKDIVKAKKTLMPNGHVEIITEYFPAYTSYLEVTAQIDSIHNSLHQDTDLSNDGPVKKVFVGENNFAVKNLKVSPSPVIRPQGKSAGRQTLSFSFDLLNVEPTNQGRSVRVVLSSDGRIIKDSKVFIPAGKMYPVNWVVPDVPLYFGTMPFKVEVNPNPREYIETSAKLNNPYSDNISTTSLQVIVNPSQYYVCPSKHTTNNWTITYYIHQWRGHVEYYDCSYWKCVEYDSYTDSKGRTHRYCSDYTYVEKTCSYCVTDSDWTESPTVSFHETFKITKVLFRSKLTQDLYGGDGKIDLLTQGPGKIKAGYGFTLEVYTNYNTNSYSSAPKPWSTRCSGKSVSPGATGYVYSPEGISLMMPYTDGIKPVVYNLTGSASGSWDDKTVYYHLPYRDAFGIKTVPEIFVNEGARNGTYTIEIDTDQFDGTPDKYYSKGGWQKLCDKVYVQIQIEGGGTDDLNTHIVE